MKIFKTILIALAILLVVIILIGFMLPSNTLVERSTSIDASQEVVFNQVNSFKTFTKWSPWYQMDTAAKIVIEGPESGVGAKYSWSGNKVGEGYQKITSSTPNSEVLIDLDFGNQGVAKVYYRITADGNKSKLIWGFTSDLGLNPFKRYFGLFIDKMIGPDFEKGLKNLKDYIEKMPKPKVPEMTVVNMKAMTVLGIPDSSDMNMQNISKVYTKSYMEIGAFMKKNKLEMGGPPMGIDDFMDKNRLGFTAGMEIKTDKVTPEGRIKLIKMSAGKMLKAVHIGSYNNLEFSYKCVFEYIAKNNMKMKGKSWSQYISDPGNTPEDKMVTFIYVPIE